MLPEFEVVPFKKTIEGSGGQRNVPDIAVVAKDLSCWFIIEVELSHHSLKYHVIPQVKTFIDGEYTREHASYLHSKIGAYRETDLHSLLRFKRPIILVLVDSESVIEQNWHENLFEAGVKLGILEVFFSDLDDSIVMYSGYLPEKPRTAEVKLKKHAYFNALTCVRPPHSLADMHSAELTVDFNGAMHRLKILSSYQEAVLFLYPQPEIETGKWYYMDYSSTSNLRIMKRRAMNDGK